MVFFDWDRSNLSEQALNTIRQAADAYKTKGNARITATGHTDTSGPESYNMALSLRRANTVKDALVRDGVPATAIAVIGKGETQPLVQTGRRRARAAEPPRRDRHPVRRSVKRKWRPTGRLFCGEIHTAGQTMAIRRETSRQKTRDRDTMQMQKGRLCDQDSSSHRSLAALPIVAQAQVLQYPGFYIGAEGGANWMLIPR